MAAEYLLHFLRVDVLPGSAEDERFDAPADEQVAAFVHHPQVAGAEPAVGGIGGFVGFGVLVIAGEQVGSFGLYFSGDAIRFGGIYPDVVDGLPAGTGRKRFRMREGQERARFRHAVADCVGDFNFFEDTFQLPV